MSIGTGIEIQRTEITIPKVDGGIRWNELVYSAKFSFEPVIGEIYHLYRDAAGQFFYLISPQEWNKEHIGLLNSIVIKKWTLQRPIYIKK
jgi:hypothetical protein